MQVLRTLLAYFVVVGSSTVVVGLLVASEPGTQPGTVVRTSIYDVEFTDLRHVSFERENGAIVQASGIFENEGEDFSPASLSVLKDEFHYLSASEAMFDPRFGFVPIPVIGQRVAARLIELKPYGSALSSPVAVHPDEIRFHLDALVDQLSAAGLVSDAKRIQDFQQHFQQEHYVRLLIAHKESQLRHLQAEIANLKLNHQSIAGQVPYKSSRPIVEAKLIKDEPVKE